MTGFSGGWLALREPADRSARHAGLVAAVAGALASRPEPVIVDLGAGTGATLRALAPALGPRQRWILVDGDAGLLALAAESLARWGRGRGAAIEAGPDGLVLAEPDGRVVIAEFRRADLALDPLPVPGRVDCVTASALLDLVSPAFLDVLAERVGRVGAAFYSALDVDGAVRLEPEAEDDGRVLAAFAADQGRDKGFGPALGGHATAVAAAAFRRRGYHVTEAESPWRLGPDDADLVSALVTGYAAVAAGAGVLEDAAAAAWCDIARASVTVGHRDLLALPPG